MNFIKTMFLRVGFVLGGVLAPALAFAQDTGSTGGSSTLNLSVITGIVNSEIIPFVDGTIVPVIFAIAFIVFLWGMVQYFIMGANSEEKRAAGKNLILWGIIAFVVMISIWGIVKIFTNTLGFDDDTMRPNLPTFTEQGGSSGN